MPLVTQQGGGTVTLPVKQTYVAGSYDPDAFIMVGKSDEQGLDFYPQVAPLRIVVPGASGTYFSKIRIEAVNGEQLSGTFSTDYNNEDATFTPVSGNSYVEMDTPNLEFGSSSPVFFVLPAITYERGLRIKVTRSSDGKEMVFSNTKSMTVSVGSMIALTSPTFTPTTAQTTPSLVEVTPSSFYVEWASSNPTKDYAKRWQILVYTNSACSGDPTRTIEIYPKTDDLHCWTDGQTPLRFVVGRLNPGATYYVKVRDVGNDNSNSTPASIPLSSAPSCVEMPVSNITTTGVALREDFREIGWSAAYYNKKTACGFYPTSSRGSDSVSKRLFDCLETDDNTTFYALDNLYGFSYDRMNTAYENSRLAKWLYSGYVYWMPGYIKLGTKNNPGYFFTPAISLAAGKTAKVSVTIKVSKFDQNTSDTWALAVVGGVVDKWTAGDETQGHNKRLANSFTLPSASDASLYRTMTFTEDDALLWTERTFDNLYMSNGDRLVIGLPDGAESGSSKARINIGSVTINVTELTEDMIIRDATSLNAFRGAIASSAGTDGRVVADFSASDIASSWTPIAGYTGTLKGQDHTISGLTKPMFDNLQGTVQNLTLNSTIAESSNVNVGMFARTLDASSASLSYCTAEGSVTGAYTAAFSEDAFIGGLVGCLVDGGSLTNCTNKARVAVSNTTSSTNSVYVGGIAGYAYNASLTSCVNNVTKVGGDNLIQNSASFTGDAARIYIGGVLGQSETSSLTGCCNLTPVSNSGASAKTVSVGGLCGGSLGSTSRSVYAVVSSCYNQGDVTNTGNSTGDTPSLRLGGLVGWVDQLNTMDGTLANHNYNNGKVKDASSSSKPAVAGVFGYVNNASTTMDYCENKSGGTVTMDRASKNITNAYVGGVIGYVNKAIKLNYVSNAAAISMETTTQATNAYVGGVLGRLTANATIKEISNSGPITINNLTCTTSFYAGGLIGENAGTISTSSTNTATGDLNVTTTSTGPSYIGGLVGYSTKSIKGINNGDVTVNQFLSNSFSDSLNVGGIVGVHTASISSCTNNGAVSNSAPVSGEHNINVGGIAGVSNANITSCSNTKSVANTSTATSGKEIRLGGVMGQGNGITISQCSNSGAVTNSAYATGVSGHPCDALVGGLAGWLTGTATLSSTSAQFSAGTGNRNSGAILDDSTTAYVGIGGLVGYLDGTGDNMAYARNLSGGSVSVVGNERAKIYVGGVLGLACYVCNMDYCKNEGALSFESLTISSQVKIGGILGAFRDDDEKFAKTTSHTITGCVNAGSITCAEYNSNGSNMAAKSKSVTAFSYIGGVSGVGNCPNKNFINCSNTGNIVVFNQLKTRLGGVVAFSNGVDLDGCSFEANIRYKRYNPQSNGGNGQVGGIVGNMLGATTAKNFNFVGSLNTNGSTPNCNTGGFVGEAGSDLVAFSNCKIKARDADAGDGFDSGIRGASLPNFPPTATNGSGLFAADNSSSAYDFSGCKIYTGTKCQRTEVTSSNLSAALIGRQAASEITNPPTITTY